MMTGASRANPPRVFWQCTAISVYLFAHITPAVTNPWSA
jgi:hypothetical protein